jgi:hypothetical protein
LRKLFGRTDIEDALKKLNNMLQKEVPMVIAQNMKATSELKDGAQPIRLVTHFMLNFVHADVKKAKEEIDKISCL